MNAALGLLDNALLQSLTYGVAVLGVAFAFRAVRYPDLTADGSFVLGAAASAALMANGWHWLPAMVAACGIGAIAGALTTSLNAWFGVNRLLSGILTTMIAYSVGFRVMSGRSNISLIDQETLFSWPETLDPALLNAGIPLHFATLLVCFAIFAFVAIAIAGLLRTEFGLALRSVGDNPPLSKLLGLRPAGYRFAGLAIANALAGLSGAIVSSRQGFADVNMGVGVVITLIAALLLGEQILIATGLSSKLSFSARVGISPLVGAATYYLLYLLVLRASIWGWIPLPIWPSDLKLLSALVVVGLLAVQNRSDEGSLQSMPI